MSAAIPEFVIEGRDNFVRNVTGMWDGMHPRDYIRIIVILGAYLLLRPYLLKFAANIQAKEFAKRNSGKDQTEPKSKMSPNQLRDGGSLKVDESEESDGNGDGVTSGAAWGNKARRRQKQNEKKAFEGKEQKKSEKGNGVNILDYLVDYEEGKEGW